MLRDIEKNIEDYHDFLLADIKQRSSFIDIVRNLYSSFSAMPREFAQVIADSSVGQFADDPQMLREHKKYSEHVRLAVLDRAPRTPGWLNESAEVFLDKLSRDPESLLPHQLAEYFIYLSKESKKRNTKGDYNALFMQLALTENEAVFNLFRNYLAQYGWSFFETRQDRASLALMYDFRMALIANHSFSKLNKSDREKLSVSVPPLTFLNAALVKHRPDGAQDAFYKKLGMSLLDHFDVFNILFQEDQKAIRKNKASSTPSKKFLCID